MTSPDPDLIARIRALTPEQRARFQEQLLAGAPGAASRRRIPPAPPQSDHPLTFAQRRLWFFEQLTPSSSVYNVGSACRVTGRLDLDRLEESLRHVVRRHPPLRSTIHDTESGAVQRVHDAAGFRLERRVPGGDPSIAANAAARELAALADQPFDLSAAPAFRAVTWRLTDADHLFFLGFHHIYTDGWSLGLVHRELNEIYNAGMEGREPVLPAIPISVFDWAHWEQSDTARLEWQAHVDYWVDHLAGAPPLIELPLDRRRLPRPSPAGDAVALTLSPALLADIDVFCREQQVSAFVLFTASWAALLAHHGAGDDLVIGTPFAARRDETSPLIGLFANTLGLRIRLEGDPSFLELLDQVKRTVLNAMPHQEAPFEQIVERLHPPRQLGHTPVFQTVVAYYAERTDDLQLRGVHSVRIESPTSSAHFDTMLALDARADGLQGRLNFRTDLFDRATAERLASGIVRLMQHAIRAPQSRLSAVVPWSTDESQLPVRNWSRGPESTSDRLIDELFSDQASCVPHKVAVVEGNRQVTYGELLARSRSIAARLLDARTPPGDLVGILCDRSIEMIAAIIGTLIAGRAYLPLDPSDPPARITTLIGEVHPALVLAPREHRDRLRDGACPIVDLEEALRWTSAITATGPRSPDDLAYVMFTSGSTGTPRAVEVTHRGVVRLIRDGRYARLDQQQVLLHMAPPQFDASTFEIWGALLHGGTLVVLRHRRPTLAALADAIALHGVTTAWLTSSLFNVVIDDAPHALQPLRQLLIGGEALSVDHVRRALTLLPETTIINGYGPTEATTFACCYEIPRDLPADATSIPLGRPIAGTDAYVLNEQGQPLPVGVPGELYLGGPGLARGYRGQPGLTAERFVAHPFAAQPGARLYRTGDRARWQREGLLEFLGRRDSQVKIRGFRVEPQELAHVLMRLPEVARAAVVANGQGADRRLVGYVVLAAGAAATPGELIDRVRGQVPDYLVPSHVMILNALPLRANGKVDDARLPDVPIAPSGVDGSVPRAGTESRLAEIWCTVLGRSAIGSTDNFFDLGGHSLSAARLLVRVEREFGRRLPIVAVFEAPTVRQMAVLIDGERSWSNAFFIPIQPDGSRRPLLAVGGGSYLRPLAARLGSDQPVLGAWLDASELQGLPRPYTVTDLASRLGSKLLAQRPASDYVLAGWCLNALLAYETARLLAAAGRPVPLVVLFDPPDPEALPLLAQPVHPAALLGRLAFHLRQLARQQYQDMPAYFGARARWLWQRARFAALLVRDETRGAGRAGAAATIGDALYLAASRYQPLPYAGRVLLIGSQDPIGDRWEDSHRHWAALAGHHFMSHLAQGDHSSLFEEPHVGGVATRLREALPPG